MIKEHSKEHVTHLAWKIFFSTTAFTVSKSKTSSQLTSVYFKFVLLLAGKHKSILQRLTVGVKTCVFCQNFLWSTQSSTFNNHQQSPVPFPNATALFASVHLVEWTQSHLHIVWLGAFHGAMILGRGYGHLEMSWERSRLSLLPSSTGWFMRIRQMEYSKGQVKQAGPNRHPKGHLT